MKVIVFGSPNYGKTSLCTSVREELGKRKVNLEVVDLPEAEVASLVLGAENFLVLVLSDERQLRELPEIFRFLNVVQIFTNDVSLKDKPIPNLVFAIAKTDLNPYTYLNVISHLANLRIYEFRQDRNYTSGSVKVVETSALTKFGIQELVDIILLGAGADPNKGA